jgi:tRNA A37 threonylcarbamoyladenosine dehydratase
MTSSEEYFSRSIMLYGKNGFDLLQESTVAVVGLGGVGSYAAEALCRAGVGGIRLVDCDIIKTTDVNRQVIALVTNAGERKVDAAEGRLRQVNPDARLDGRHVFFHEDTAEDILGGDLAFVIDAIDSMNPKAELISQCVGRSLPVISALGAAGKTDPMKVRLGVLTGTQVCPLARTLRRYLRNRNVTTDIPVVYSTETPLRPHPDGPPACRETSGTYVRGRARESLPSLPTLPAIFGLIAANYVILELIKTVAGHR